MTDERTSRRSFLRRLGVFVGVGFGALAVPATAWASTYCCPHVAGHDPCQPGQFYCTGNCPGQQTYCDTGTWNDNICHRIGC